MKKVLAMFVLLMFYCLPVFAADDAEVVDSFKQYTSDNMEKVLATYAGDTHKVIYSAPDSYFKASWFKVKDEIDPNYKIDVQKTNSLISPYIATLEVKCKSVFYIEKQTKEEAKAVDEFSFNNINNIVITTYQFTLAYQDDRWVITDAEQLDSLTNKWYPANKKDVFEVLRFKPQN